ncbi:cysteine proteinase [Clavulina sp. PMI_390]|nr:cysteine proteinase [Clavulina sp. PMI_390]
MPLIENWWSDRFKTLSSERPGPGFLPPNLERELHFDSLFLINVRDLPAPSPTAVPSHIPPTLEHIYATLPPKLFYDRQEHGWRYIDCFSSSSVQILQASRDPKRHPPIPGSHLRDRRPDCTVASQVISEHKKTTHHFHAYLSILDSAKLPNPLLHLNAPFPNQPPSPEDAFNQAKETPEGYLLDAFVCSLCQTQVYASPLIPAVIPGTIRDRLTVRLQRNPTVGHLPGASIGRGWGLILRILEGWLFDGKSSSLGIRGRTFQGSLGWNDEVADVFQCLGWTPITHDGDTDVSSIGPPSLDDPLAVGATLRAWIEISAYIASILAIDASLIEFNHDLKVSAVPCMDRLKDAVGINKMTWDLAFRPLPKFPLTDIMVTSFRILGLDPDSYSAHWLKYAYRQNLRCDPQGAPLYLDAFKFIAEAAENDLSELLNFFLVEKSKGYWTNSDYHQAIRLLGFGDDGYLRMEFEPNEVDGQFIVNAFSAAYNLLNQNSDPSRLDIERKDLREAALIAAQSTKKEDLVAYVDKEVGKRTRDPATAYTTLGANKDMDDDLVLAIFNMRAVDEPMQSVKWTEALETIALDRESARLKGFLETGVDPGSASTVAEVKPEFPRGLHQLGNTCYLNSLLQYFFTVKDLRDSLSSGTFDISAPVKDEDLKTTVIGGRHITHQELNRSRRFVALLNDLFQNLACAESPAVLPEVELAKLALLTSKDEETENRPEQEAAGTSTGSTDTDSTLVEGQTAIEDGSVPSSPPSQPMEFTPSSPNTVLGKRSSEQRDVEQSDRRSPMEIDGPSSPQAQVSPKFTPTDPAVDVEMQDVPSSSTVLPPPKTVAGPPPLPPRKKPEPVGEMMFGKQNDVSECMDNCIFQIECALQFDPTRSSQPEKPNVVKQLFYGKSRQRIKHFPESGKPEPTVSSKEDIFAQLLVNVSDEGLDLYDGLGHFLDDTVEFEGKQAEMEIDLLELPPILQIQLQRVQFDRDTLQAKKNNAYVKFEETLRMDRFMDAADPLKKEHSRVIQNQLRSCRNRVAELSERAGVTYSETLATAKSVLSGGLASLLPEADAELSTYLESESEFVTVELERSRSEARGAKQALETLWGDSSDAEYELCSVFIHRGNSPSWGHYFFYSRDLPNNPDQWYKYNDSEVTLVGKEEIFQDTTGSTANPYLLVYARKGANVIDTVHRILPS